MIDPRQGLPRPARHPRRLQAPPEKGEAEKEEKENEEEEEKQKTQETSIT